MTTVDANVWVAAFDTTDVFHARSVGFLREAMRRNIRLSAPSFVLVEVACVVARRFRDPLAGARAAAVLTADFPVQIVPCDDALLSTASQLGSQRFLRGADALYAATAEVTGSALVSWDRELIERAGALTPTAWLEANR